MRQEYSLTEIKDLFADKEKYADKKVTVGGWIRSNRDSKKIGFITLNDGSCFQTLQLVYSNELENFAQAAKLNIGSAVIATGTIVLTPRVRHLPIIRCRKNATRLNISARSPISESVRTHLQRYSVSVR